MNDQLKIPCIFMRSGTSRGPYFLKDDLPADVQTRDKVLLAVMGSPDNRQIDGLGGAEPVTSKVAIISKSDEEGIDVNYQFAQVKIDEPIVDTKPSCGNILVGVGPYSIEKGLVEAQEGSTKVVIRDVNTGMKIEEVVRTPNKIVAYEGDLKIDGVPNPGSPIDINFLEVIGSKTNKLFPTGNKIDVIDGIECSMVDSAESTMEHSIPSITSILFPVGNNLLVLDPITSKKLISIGDPGLGTPSIFKSPS